MQNGSNGHFAGTALACHPRHTDTVCAAEMYHHAVSSLNVPL
jgi:hypothetical protein